MEPDETMEVDGARLEELARESLREHLGAAGLSPWGEGGRGWVRARRSKGGGGARLEELARESLREHLGAAGLSPWEEGGRVWLGIGEASCRVSAGGPGPHPGRRLGSGG